jgi:site-specific DNA recombinase
MMQRAAFYARVSTARQEQEQTIDSQVAALEAAAQTAGVWVPPERRYIDDGFSGSRLDRPGMDALRDAAADGLLDIAFIHCPDRLARNFVHQQVVLEELAKRGVEVRFVEHPIGERAEDRLLVQMQGVIAEYERAKIVERTRRGKAHKVRTGQIPPFSAAPYGYAIERTTAAPHGVVVIDEVQAEHVRAIYRWVRDEDLTIRQIATRLNELGVPPARKAFWVQSSVLHILKNSAYTGRAYFGKTEPVEPKKPMRPGGYRKALKSSHVRRPRSQWIEVSIPAIIDAKLQQEAQACLRRHTHFSSRNVQREYLLRGMVTCGLCGLRMEAAHKRFTGRFNCEYFWYACRGHLSSVDTGRPTKCTAKCVRANELDDVVWQAIVAWLQSPEMLRQEIASWRASRASMTQLTRERAKASATDRQLGLQIDRLVEAYQHGALKVEELKARRERLEVMRSGPSARQRLARPMWRWQEPLTRLAPDWAPGRLSPSHCPRRSAPQARRARGTTRLPTPRPSD